MGKGGGIAARIEAEMSAGAGAEGAVPRSGGEDAEEVEVGRGRSEGGLEIVVDIVAGLEGGLQVTAR